MTTYTELLDKMENGNKNLIIFGRGGSGKTHLICKYLEQTQKRVLPLTPTGITSLIIPGAVTIHSAFHLKPTVALPWERSLLSDIQSARLAQYDTILIDEVSMVRVDILNQIDLILQDVHDNSKPFGGVRLILLGDLFQLPPISIGVDAPYVKDVAKILGSGSQNLLNSRSIMNAVHHRGIEIYELFGRFRQSDEDKTFLTVLDKIRLGTAGAAELAYLNTRVTFIPQPKALILTPTRKARDLYNQQGILALNRPIFWAMPVISWAKGETPVDNLLDDYPAAHIQPLADGMRIIFTKSDSHGRWVNGSRGNIQEVVTTDGSNPAYLLVELDSDLGRIHEVHQDVFNVYLPGYSDKAKRSFTRVVCTLIQFPVEPGYATTIHKSQGLTLEKVVVSMDRGAFAPGQLYVALSRVKGPDDLHLSRPLNKNDIIADKRILTFYLNNLIGICPVRP